MAKKMEISDSNFNEEVIMSQIPVIIEFWASWCPPCKAMEPMLKKIQNQLEGRAKVLKINVDLNPQSAEKHEILGVPSIILFKNGVEERRLVGAQTEEKIFELVK